MDTVNGQHFPRYLGKVEKLGDTVMQGSEHSVTVWIRIPFVGPKEVGTVPDLVGKDS